MLGTARYFPKKNGCSVRMISPPPVPRPDRSFGHYYVVGRDRFLFEVDESSDVLDAFELAMTMPLPEYSPERNQEKNQETAVHDSKLFLLLLVCFPTPHFQPVVLSLCILFRNGLGRGGAVFPGFFFRPAGRR